MIAKRRGRMGRPGKSPHSSAALATSAFGGCVTCGSGPHHNIAGDADFGSGSLMARGWMAATGHSSDGCANQAVARRIKPHEGVLADSGSTAVIPEMSDSPDRRGLLPAGGSYFAHPPRMSDDGGLQSSRSGARYCNHTATGGHPRGACSEPSGAQLSDLIGSLGWNRTNDQRINSPTLIVHC